VHNGRRRWVVGVLVLHARGKGTVPEHSRTRVLARFRPVAPVPKRFVLFAFVHLQLAVEDNGADQGFCGKNIERDFRRRAIDGRNRKRKNAFLGGEAEDDRVQFAARQLFAGGRGDSGGWRDGG